MSDASAWPVQRRITVRDLQAATDRGERWSMLTSYDTLTAGIFEQAGVRALLVGDTSAEMVLGYGDTLPVTMDALVSMVQAVVRGTRTALVVADLPFGSYQAGPEQALDNAVRHLKEGGAQAVKLEGGRRVVPQVEAITGAGHPGHGPPRADPAERQRARRDAPGPGPRRRGRRTARRRARPGTRGRVRGRAGVGARRAWPARLRGAADTHGRHRGRAGLRRPDHGLAGHGRAHHRPGFSRFVKRYADIRAGLLDAASRYAAEVADQSYPDTEHSYA